METLNDPDATRRKVREGYAAIARSHGATDAGDEATREAAATSGCCEPSDVKSSGGYCGARTDAA